jgi:hypothetical protein
MVHATDLLTAQPDLAALKMDLKQGQEEFGLVDLMLLSTDFDSDSPPDTPSSTYSDNDMLAMPPLLDRDNEFFDPTLSEQFFLEGNNTQTNSKLHGTQHHNHSSSNSTCSSRASSTVMWNLREMDTDDLDVFLSSPSSPDANLLDAPVLELDVFGLESHEVRAPHHSQQQQQQQQQSSTSKGARASAFALAGSASTATTPQHSSSVTLPARPKKRPAHHHHPMVIYSQPKHRSGSSSIGGVKRRTVDVEDNSIEAKKVRARATRDEISARAQAALRSSATSAPSTPVTSAAAAAAAPLIMSAAGGKLDSPELRRITHNVLERKRREDLKTSYQDLRFQIPDLEQNDRAPTGQILLKAVEMIEALRREEAVIAAGLAAARAENERLRALCLC